MPRQSRIDAPGALHPLIIRGIERKAIFKDDADRTEFVERMEAIFADSSTPCYAWTLITNLVLHGRCSPRHLDAPFAYRLCHGV
jgi:putative transposase